MSFAIVVMRRVVRRLLIVQIFITLFIALAYLILYGLDGLSAAIYGGCITLSGTLLMAWRIARAGEAVSAEQQQAFIEDLSRKPELLHNQYF